VSDKIGEVVRTALLRGLAVAAAYAAAFALVRRAAPSSQTASPDRLSALCGSASPSASATTCAVAAAPRN
jgi:hypothetical protein